MKKLTILAAVCCLVLASCGGGGGNSSPSGPVIEMNELFKKGDYEKAVQYWADNTDFSDSGKSKEEQTEQLKELVSALSSKMKEESEKHGGIESFKITEETVGEDGLSAHVKGVTTYRDGETDDQDMDMVKVDGKWMFRNTK